MGPSNATNFFSSSSDVIATKCFNHTIIIRRQTVVCVRACVRSSAPPDDDCMIKTFCGNNIGRGGEKNLLR
jgi:hypothetical protein